MKRLLRLSPGVLVLAMAFALTAQGREPTDAFDGPELLEGWTFRSANDQWVSFKNGWLVFDVPAEQNLFTTTIDAPMLLTDPPDSNERFTLDTVVQARGGALPRGAYAGIILIRDDLSAYLTWGPKWNLGLGGVRWDGKSYSSYSLKHGRFHRTVWLRIERRGTDFYVFYKDFEEQEWQPGGITDTFMPAERLPIGEFFTPGAYKVGIYVESGDEHTEVAFDTFDSPDLPPGLDVDADSKAAVTWGALKSR
jgi:hypothetical protein